MAFEKERLAKQQVEQTARVDGRRRRQSFDARQHAKERQRAKQVLDKNLYEDNLQLGGGSFNLHPDETVTTDGDSELFPELRRLCAQSHGKLLSAEDRALQSKLIAIKWNNGQGQLTEAEEDLMRENIVVRIQSQWRIKKAARLVRKLRKEDRALRAMSRRIREERKELLEPSTVDQQRRISREQSHRHVEAIRRKSALESRAKLVLEREKRRQLAFKARKERRALDEAELVDRLVEETLKKHQSMLVPEYSHSECVLDRAVLSRDSSDRPRATAVSGSAKLAVSNEAAWGAPRCSSADGRAATAVSAEPTRWAMRPVVNIEGIYAEFDLRIAENAQRLLEIKERSLTTIANGTRASSLQGRGAMMPGRVSTIRVVRGA